MTRNRMGAIGRGAAALSLLLAAGCQMGTPISPVRLEAEQRRLLAPFLDDVEVGCVNLVIAMSPALYPFVSQPATDPIIHKFTDQEIAGIREKSWINLGGNPATGFVVTVGENPELPSGGQVAATRFRVIRSVVLRIIEHEHNEMTFDLDATGPPLLLIDG